MDSLTHIVVGACIGEALLGKETGKKAMMLGAIAQSFPDIDFIVATWLTPADNLLAHRGFTHSILFVIILSVVLGLLVQQWQKTHDLHIRKWSGFFGLQMFVHIFLDAFNAYGVGWFEPFSHYRVSFNVIFVADPLFSIIPGIVFLALLILPSYSKKRKLWVRIGLVAPALYLLLATFNKLSVDRETRQINAREHIAVKRFTSTPTVFNIFLWYIVMENDSGYQITYRSVFDKQQKTDYQFFPRNDSLLPSLTTHPELNKLLRFSKGYYTMEKWHDTLVFNDLRFGQEAGWKDPKAHFVFHYFLKEDADNKFVMQRSRFAGLDQEGFFFLLQRIKGK